MANRVPAIRHYKITITKDGKPSAAFEIKAMDSEEAKDEAWGQYESEHGSVDLFDTSYDTEVEEFLTPPRS